MSNPTKWLRNSLCAVALIGSMTTTTQAEQVSMESASPNSLLGMIPQAMAGYWAANDIELQLSLNQTLTKSLLKVAAGKLDLAVAPPLSYNAMTKNAGPYKKMGDKASALAANVRSLFGLPGGTYHAITWADENIKDWPDATGKRVYIGPPAGAANTQVIALATKGGLIEGTYDPIKAPWGAATQSFQDGQFDVYVGNTSIGSQTLAELSLSHEIRLLSLADKSQTPDPSLGLQLVVIPPNTYPGQVNKSPVISWQTVMMMVAHKDFSEETAYKLTKTFLENRAKVAQNNVMLSQLSDIDPFAGVNAPLHPGAVRYYQEAGIAIPARLLAQ